MNRSILRTRKCESWSWIYCQAC